MALMGIFGRGPMSDKKIDKIAKLASNPFAQPDVRKKEMQRLLQEGTETAYRGVLKRFSSNANGQIADEEEKKWLEDEIVEIGASIREPLREYIRSNKTLSYALRAYERIFGLDEALQFFLSVLNEHGPEAYREAEAKQQLALALSEHADDAAVIDGLVPFLEDHSDDVRWAVLDALDSALSAGSLSDHTSTRYAETMGRILTDDSTGPRVQRRIAEFVMQRKWRLPLGGDDVCPLLEEHYFVDKKGYLRRRD